MSTQADALNQADRARIFVAEILPESGLNEATSQTKPKAILLGGQPGSGKGGLARRAETEFLNDIVKIDPDELRDYHPDIQRFRQETPYNWASRTQSDSNYWVTKLLDATTAEKKNLVFDTSLSDGVRASKLIQDLQGKGYDVEVRVMASPKLESELGVDQRFRESLGDFGHGHSVLSSARDTTSKNLPLTRQLHHISDSMKSCLTRRINDALPASATARSRQAARNAQGLSGAYPGTSA